MAWMPRPKTELAAAESLERGFEKDREKLGLPPSATRNEIYEAKKEAYKETKVVEHEEEAKKKGAEDRRFRSGQAYERIKGQYGRHPGMAKLVSKLEIQEIDGSMLEPALAKAAFRLRNVINQEKGDSDYKDTSAYFQHDDPKGFSKGVRDALFRADNRGMSPEEHTAFSKHETKIQAPAEMDAAVLDRLNKGEIGPWGAAFDMAQTIIPRTKAAFHGLAPISDHMDRVSKETKEQMWGPEDTWTDADKKDMEEFEGKYRGEESLARLGTFLTGGLGVSALLGLGAKGGAAATGAGAAAARGGVGEFVKGALKSGVHGSGFFIGEEAGGQLLQPMGAFTEEDDFFQLPLSERTDRYWDMTKQGFITGLGLYGGLRAGMWGAGKAAPHLKRLPVPWSTKNLEGMGDMVGESGPLWRAKQTILGQQAFDTTIGRYPTLRKWDFTQKQLDRIALNSSEEIQGAFETFKRDYKLSNSEAERMLYEVHSAKMEVAGRLGQEIPGRFGGPVPETPRTPTDLAREQLRKHEGKVPERGQLSLDFQKETPYFEGPRRTPGEGLYLETESRVPTEGVAVEGQIGKTGYSFEAMGEGPKVGDKVQWTSGGVDQFKTPKRITRIMDDHIQVEGSATGIPIAEINIVETARPGQLDLPFKGQTGLPFERPGKGVTPARPIPDLPKVTQTGSVAENHGRRLARLEHDARKGMDVWEPPGEVEVVRIGHEYGLEVRRGYESEIKLLNKYEKETAVLRKDKARYEREVRELELQEIKARPEQWVGNRDGSTSSEGPYAGTTGQGPYVNREKTLINPRTGQENQGFREGDVVTYKFDQSGPTDLLFITKVDKHGRVLQAYESHNGELMVRDGKWLEGGESHAAKEKGEWLLSEYTTSDHLPGIERSTAKKWHPADGNDINRHIREFQKDINVKNPIEPPPTPSPEYITEGVIRGILRRSSASGEFPRKTEHTFKVEDMKTNEQIRTLWNKERGDLITIEEIDFDDILTANAKNRRIQKLQSEKRRLKNKMARRSEERIPTEEELTQEIELLKRTPHAGDLKKFVEGVNTRPWTKTGVKSIELVEDGTLPNGTKISLEADAIEPQGGLDFNLRDLGEGKTGPTWTATIERPATAREVPGGAKGYDPLPGPKHSRFFPSKEVKTFPNREQAVTWLTERARASQPRSVRPMAVDDTVSSSGGRPGQLALPFGKGPSGGGGSAGPGQLSLFGSGGGGGGGRRGFDLNIGGRLFTRAEAEAKLLRDQLRRDGLKIEQITDDQKALVYKNWRQSLIMDPPPNIPPDTIENFINPLPYEKKTGESAPSDAPPVEKADVAVTSMDAPLKAKGRLSKIVRGASEALGGRVGALGDRRPQFAVDLLNQSASGKAKMVNRIKHSIEALKRMGLSESEIKFVDDVLARKINPETKVPYTMSDLKGSRIVESHSPFLRAVKDDRAALIKYLEDVSDPAHPYYNRYSPKLIAQLTKEGDEYLGRFYKQFELKGWKPSSEMRAKFSEYVQKKWGWNENGAEKLMDHLASGDAGFAHAKVMAAMDGDMRPFLEDVGKFVSNNRGLNLNTQRLMKIKNLPPEYREFLGEITDGTWRVMKTASDVKGMRLQYELARKFVDNADKLHKFNRDHPMRLGDPSITLRKYLGEGGFNVKGMQNELLEGVADVPLPVWAVEDLAESMFFAQQSTDMISQFVNRFVSTMKVGKVAWNVPSHFRQLFGNIIYSPMSGTSFLNPRNAKFYKAAYQEIKTQGPMYEEAMDAGLFGGEFFTNEERKALEYFLRDSLRASDKAFAGVASETIPSLMGKTKKISDWAIDRYSLMDKWFKMASYMKARGALNTGGTRIRTDVSLWGRAMPYGVQKHKLTAPQAAQHANRFLPDYRNLGKWAQNTRKQPFSALIFNPYYAFTSSNMAVWMNGMRYNPLAVAGIGGAMTYMMRYAWALEGLWPEQWRAANQVRGLAPLSHKQADRERKFQPSFNRAPSRWLAQVPLARSADGDRELLDMTYIFPGADMFYGTGLFDNSFHMDDIVDVITGAATNIFFGGFGTGGRYRFEDQYPLSNNKTLKATQKAIEFFAPNMVSYDIPELLRSSIKGAKYTKYGEKKDWQSPALGLVGLRMKSSGQASKAALGREIKRGKGNIKREMSKLREALKRKEITPKQFTTRMRRLERAVKNWKAEIPK